VRECLEEKHLTGKGARTRAADSSLQERRDPYRNSCDSGRGERRKANPGNPLRLSPRAPETAASGSPLAGNHARRPAPPMQAAGSAGATSTGNPKLPERRRKSPAKRTPPPTTPTAFNTVAQGWTRSVLPWVNVRPNHGRANLPPSTDAQPRPNPSTPADGLLLPSENAEGVQECGPGLDAQRPTRGIRPPPNTAERTGRLDRLPRPSSNRRRLARSRPKTRVQLERLSPKSFPR
jgi:hypothetical protein